jgi:hypothetical protein
MSPSAGSHPQGTRRARRFLAGSAIVATLGCAAAEGGSAPLSTAIRALDSSYVAAWLRDDTAAVLATLAPTRC